MLTGPAPGRTFRLGRPITIVGRDPNCDVVLPDAAVSRRHARVVRTDDGYVLEDLGSTGGTILNGRPLPGPAPLHDGDRIEIGGCQLTFSDPDIVPNTWTTQPPHILTERNTTETAEMALVSVRPDEKLAAVLAISRSLVGALSLGEVLGQVLDALFKIFPRAERGLFLFRDEREGALVPAAVKIRRGEPAGPAVSRAIQEYVLAEGKVVLSEDVAVDSRFRGSRSAEEARIRSLMCVPLRDHTRRPTGLLQLDTSDPEARFVAEDLDLLAAVAGQVAIAVNNARLLEQSRLEQRRLEILSEAGIRLGATLDVEETLRDVARLAVPFLADLCLVDLLEEGGAIRGVAAVHADPTKQPLADELLRRYPLDPAGRHPAALALRSGRAEAADSIDDAFLEATTRDAEHLALVRRLGVRSYLCIPLVARGRALGVVSLGATGDRRPLGPPDRVTAEELARRAALAADNARLYQAASAASQAKDRFLAVLSHELRNPLMPILLAASAMLEGEAAPNRSTLEMVRRNVELEARLIDDLLDVARIGRGVLRLDPEIVDAHESIQRAVAICREETDAAGLAIDLDLAADSHHVRVDPTRLLQVGWNLIRNAAKFTPAGGRLTIRSSNRPERAGGRQDGFLVVEFRDTGVGIEPKLLGRIFEAFEQGDSELRGRHGGLGLGLAISRAIAEAHGGLLTADSPGPGLGATFRLELPTVPAPSRAPAAVVPPARTTSPAPGGKVLLVEDNRDILRYLATVLRMRGYEVTEAASLAEARVAASGSSFDLLLSDIELPDGTGLELMRDMQRLGTTAGIAMSGYGSEEDVHQSRAAGFAAHLTKPVDVPTLEAAIRRASSRGEDRGREPIRGPAPDVTASDVPLPERRQDDRQDRGEQE
jgi:signal transduction histidine kinase/ActR/RegA family two-component response regulator